MPSDKTQMWGEQYDRKCRTCSAIHARNKRARFVEKLKLKSFCDEKGLAKHTLSNEAYSLFERRFYWNKRRTKALKKSIECFNQRLKKIPARIGLRRFGDCYVVPAILLPPRNNA